MAELATHRAALRKYDESNARSIDRAECFKLVDSSESHDSKIKKSCSAKKKRSQRIYVLDCLKNMHLLIASSSIFKGVMRRKSL